MFRVCCVIVAILINPAAWAASASDREIEAYLRQQLSAEGVPGASWAILREGKVSSVGAMGVTGEGHDVTPDTPFIIGSLTKSFTAVAMMQLVEDGKVNLDAPVVTYLPWFKLADASAAKKITVRDTLNQTTGLAWIDGLGWLSSKDLSPQAFRRRIEGLASVTPVAPPGTKMIYSNVNYSIAGAVIESVSGQPYEAFVQRRIIVPMGLTQTSADVSTFGRSGFALPHRYWFWRPFSLPQAPIGRSDLASYLISSSARDMGTYILVHLLGENPFGPSVLSAAGFDTVQKGALPFPFDKDDRYAMGWSDSLWGPTNARVRVLNHYGSWIGYHSNMLLAPDQGLGLVLLTNAESYVGNRPRWEIAKNAFRRLLGQDNVQKAWFDASVASLAAMSVVCLALVGWCVSGFRRLMRRGVGSLSAMRALSLGLGIAAAFFFGVPAAFDADLVSIWWTTPDAGVLIVAAIGLSLVGGLVNCLARRCSNTT